MVLLDPVVEVSVLPDADRQQWPLRLVSKPALAIAGNNCLPVGLAAVDDDALRPTVMFQRFAQEAFRRRQVTVLAEEELDRVAAAIDRAVKIRPPSANPDIGFINVPLASNRTFSPVEAFKQQRREVSDPAMD